MFSKTQRFVLVGPHQGKTMNVNGYEFVDGEYEFAGNDGQIASLTRVFGFYGALPAEQAELQELRFKQGGKPTRKQLDEAIAALPGENTDADYAVGAMRFYFGDLFTQGDELMVREVVVAPLGDADQATVGQNTNTQEPPAPPALPSLAEAIGLLDPAADQDWTFNNLPNLERLEALTGKKPFCADVDAIADGYTRAKAKAAKA